ncbi:uncharacterized protein LOC124269252 [Haliotis rubra]|uniref:uncharacterized protein LOC124269252 n=1 Tax=Haliotis rubra TaxID=36100 RepID=UPI001EE54C3F|nr:uncharacterized protein LOC124269252 [Haliotis rubra]
MELVFNRVAEEAETLIIVVCMPRVHSACYPSPCYSLQNKLDGIVMDNEEDIRLWCEVAVPYTECLNKLPLECRTTGLEDIIEETKYQMNQIPCGSSRKLTVSIGLFILISINTFLL